MFWGPPCAGCSPFWMPACVSVSGPCQDRPKGPSASARQPRRQDWGPFRREDLGHIRARAEAAFLSERLPRAPCWGIAPSVLRPGRLGATGHRTPAPLPLASARQPGGCSNRVPHLCKLKASQRTEGPWRPRTAASPSPCPLPPRPGGSEHPALTDGRWHARCSQNRSGSGFSVFSPMPNLIFWIELGLKITPKLT